MKRVPSSNGADKLDLIVSDGDEYQQATLSTQLSTVTFESCLPFRSSWLLSCLQVSSSIEKYSTIELIEYTSEAVENAMCDNPPDRHVFKGACLMRSA